MLNREQGVKLAKINKCTQFFKSILKRLPCRRPKIPHSYFFSGKFTPSIRLRSFCLCSTLLSLLSRQWSKIGRKFTSQQHFRILKRFPQPHVSHQLNAVFHQNEDISKTLVDIPWYKLPKDQQLNIAHVLNRLQNGCTLTIGPFSELNFETSTNVSFICKFHKCMAGWGNGDSFERIYSLHDQLCLLRTVLPFVGSKSITSIPISLLDYQNHLLLFNDVGAIC